MVAQRHLEGRRPESNVMRRSVLSTFACRPRLMSIVLGKLICMKCEGQWPADERRFFQEILQNGGLSLLSDDVTRLVRGCAVTP
jgi:hypothetical protein